MVVVGSETKASAPAGRTPVANGVTAHTGDGSVYCRSRGPTCANTANCALDAETERTGDLGIGGNMAPTVAGIEAGVVGLTKELDDWVRGMTDGSGGVVPISAWPA